MDQRTQVIVVDQSDLVRPHHHRRCSVCRHPCRAAIEEAFLQWRKVSLITKEFGLPGRTSLYRHAHARGLFARRGRNLRHALGLIIEQAEAVTPSASTIIRAVQAYARLTDDGRWIEPPAHVIVSSGSSLVAPNQNGRRLPGAAKQHARPLVAPPNGGVVASADADSEPAAAGRRVGAPEVSPARQGWESGVNMESAVADPERSRRVGAPPSNLGSLTATQVELENGVSR